MADSTFEKLQKLLVNVPEGKTEDFKDKYYTGHDDDGKDIPEPEGHDDRQKDYDNKVVFLHDTHEIFTHNELFGSKPTVGANNTIEADGTKYTLHISDKGVLTLDPYKASSIGTCAWYATTTTGDATKEISTSYTMSVTPANKLYINVNVGTEETAVLGIKAKSSSDSDYEWIVGGDYTITNGVAQYTTAGYDVKYFTSFSQTDVTLDTDDAAYVAADSKTVTVTATKQSLSLESQSFIVYVHEKGQAEAYVSKVITVTNSASVTGKYGYYWMTGASFAFASASSALGTGLPISSSMKFAGDATGASYGWIAFPLSWLGASSVESAALPTITEYDSAGNKGADGGWYFAKDASGNRITETHDDTTFVLFRTDNPVLAEAYYRVTK